MDLLLHVALSCEVATIVATQTKEGLYQDWYLANLFFPLAIEVFGCSQQQANIFFHHCVNMAWVTKGFEGPLLLALHVFYK
jgi:hypothetical protein